MSRRQKDPLRPLQDTERVSLTRLSRSGSAAAAQVARARALLAVAEGQDYTAAAHLVGRRTGDTVARWVAAFNSSGLAAVVPRHGGGHPVRYGEAEQRRILAEVAPPPAPARGGPARGGRGRLQAALRRAERTACPGSAPTRSAALCMEPGCAGRRAGPGAKPAWSCASANATAWSPSLIQMRRQKGADRAGLHARFPP